MRKRIWAVLLSVCLLVGLLPTTALADTESVTLSLNYDDTLCDIRVIDGNTQSSDDPTVFVSGNGQSASVPSGSWAIFEITNIKSGYRIGSVTLNGTDRTQSFVNGAYGGFSIGKVSTDYALTAVMEKIPDPLPSVTSVTLYTDSAGTQPAAENITYTTESTEARLYGKATFIDGVEYPVYYARGQWQFSTDGTTWQDTECWGSNWFDFWPGWDYHEELDFLNASYDIRLKVEPKNLYTTGDPVYSNVIHINGGAVAAPTDPENPATDVVLYVNGVDMVNGGTVDGAVYTAATNTLTLTNASITGYYADADAGTRAGIYYQGNATLNIKLSGENTVSISCTSDQIGYGIDSSGPVTITGSGTLDFQTQTDGESTKGYVATTILATDLTVTGSAAVTADLPTVGTYDNLGSIVSLSGDLTVSNDASLTATGKYEAVKTSGDVNIATGGSLTAKAITAVNAGGSVTVENGSFTADAVGTSANMGYAVKFAGNMTISGDSTVLVNQSADASYAYGLYNTAACNLTISGGTVKIANGSNGTHQAIRLQNSASTFTMTGGDVTVNGGTGLYYGLYNAGTANISGGVLRHTGDLYIGGLTTLSGESNVTVNGAAYLNGLTMQDSAALDATNSTGTAVTSYEAVQVTGGTLTASSGTSDALNLTGGDLTVDGGTVDLTGGRYGLYLSNTNGSNLIYESGVLSASGSNGAVVWFSWDTDFSANSPASIAEGTPITPAGAKLLTATMDGAYAAAYVTSDTDALTYEGTTVTNAVKSITFGAEPCENHDWGDWVETQAPTCTKTGVKKHTCSVCGETETQDIDALGHDYKAVVTAPTCTEQGYTTHTCSRCGDSYVDTYVNALGHTWGEWTVTTPATCTEAGVEKRTCSVCGETETQDITALGHDYEAVVTAPTCTEQGYTTHTCSRCGDSYVDTYTDALNHNYVDIVTAPTCTEKGYTTHTCSRCGDSYKDTYVDAPGHDWDKGVITTPPTLDADGVKTFTCQRCGETQTESVPKLEKQAILLPGSIKKTYGDNDFYSEATNTTVGGGALTYASSNTAVAQVDAQSGKVTIVGAGDTVITVTAAAVANKYAETSATYAVTVAKAPLTITAKDKAITYGEKAANSGYDVSGFVKDEDESVLSGEAVYSYTYKQYDNVGQYQISVSGLTAQNYDIAFVDGKLNVAQATEYTITLSDLEQLAGHVSGVTARIDPYDTSAVLSVEYEVGDSWTATAPQTAGEYSVRATLTTSDNIVVPAPAAYTEGTLTVKPGVTVDTGSGEANDVDVTVTVDTESGTAKITVSEENLDKIAENANGQVSIDLGSVSDVDTLVLPGNLVEELSKSDKAESLTVSTENASVTLSADVLDSVAKTVTGGEDTVSVRLESVAENELKPAQKAALDAITTDYPVAVVDVSLVVTHPDGSTDTLHELGGNVTVTVPYEQLPGLLDGQYVVACYISDDGTVTYLFAQADETNRTITFTTNHFSNYAVFVSGKPTSAVTVDGGSGSGIYLAGDTVTIKADSKSGYTFAGWEVVSGDVTLTDTKAAETTFIMPAANVELRATYAKITSGGGGGVSTYTLTFDTNGGSKIDSVSKTSGTTIDLTEYVPTRTRYDFDGWYSDAKLTAKITSVKLTKNMTVYAKWAEKGGENPFTDVADDAYYADAVIWAVGKGITSGTTATTFSPNAACTRAQAVTFLWRAAGSPVVNYAMNFSDVSADAYYGEAVRWAVSQGITMGTSDTAFSPNAACTRAQIVTFLWRSQKSPASDSVNPFTDVADDAYYTGAVLWAAENGVTGGTTATTFSPANDCTRAQIVTFLYRFFVK